MNKGESKNHTKETADLSGCLRIKDHLGHFLGEIEDGVLRIYCKRCKKFFEVPINHLILKKF